MIGIISKSQFLIALLKAAFIFSILAHGAKSQELSDQQKGLLRNNVNNYLKARSNAFRKCTCRKGVEIRRGIGRDGRPTIKPVFDDACEGTGKILDLGYVSKIIESFAENAKPDVFAPDVKQAYTTATKGLQPQRGSYSRIWNHSRLGTLAKALRVSEKHIRLKGKPNVEYLPSGVALATIRTSVDGEPIRWAWMKSPQHKKWRWLIVDSLDVEAWEIEFRRLRNAPDKKLRSIRTSMFRITFGEAAVRNLSFCQAELAKFEDDYSNFLHLPEYHSLQQLLNVRKTQVALGPDPKIEEALKAFGKLSRRSTLRGTEAGILALELAKEQESRPARFKRALDDIGRLKVITNERPWVAAQVLKRIGDRDMRIATFPEFKKASIEIEKAQENHEAERKKHVAVTSAKTKSNSLLEKAKVEFYRDRKLGQELAKQALDADPALQDAHRILMKAAVLETKWDRVAEVADALLKISAKDKEALLYAAIARIRQGNLSQGRAFIEQAKTLKTEELRSLELLTQGLMFESSGDRTRAHTTALQTTDSLRTKPDFEIEEEAAALLSRVAPDEADEANIATDRAADFGTMPSAEKSLEVGLSKSNRIEKTAYFRRAIELAKKEIQLGHKEARAWAIIGKCCLFLGQPQESISAFDSALELFANDSETALYRGIAKQWLGQHDSALTDFRFAQSSEWPSLAPRSILSIRNEALLRSSCCCLAQNLFEQARGFAESAVESQEIARGPASFNIAFSYYQEGEYEPAIVQFSQSKVRFPEPRASEPEFMSSTLIFPLRIVGSLFEQPKLKVKGLIHFHCGCCRFKLESFQASLSDFKAANSINGPLFVTTYATWWAGQRAGLSKEEWPKFVEFDRLMEPTGKRQ